MDGHGSQGRHGRQRCGHALSRVQRTELFGGGACGGGLRGVGLGLAEPCDCVGESAELLRELQQLPCLRRQGDADGGQGGGGGAQPPTRRRPQGSCVVLAAPGVFERAGGVGVRTAGPSLGELRDDGEQVRRRPRRIPGQPRVGAAVHRGADLHGRSGCGVLRRLPQPLPFLRCQAKAVRPRPWRSASVLRTWTGLSHTSAAGFGRGCVLFLAAPAALQLWQGQVRGELPAAEPDRRSAVGAAGQGDGVAGDLPGGHFAHPRPQQHTLPGQLLGEVLPAARAGGGGPDELAQHQPVRCRRRRPPRGALGVDGGLVLAGLAAARRS